MGRVDILENDLVSHLEDFVENIRTQYINELSENATAKKNELDAIMKAKITAEQNQLIVQELTIQADELKTEQAVVKKLKGGILKNV